MEPGTFTRPSSASCAGSEAALPSLEFDLPEDGHFRPLPPQVPFDRFLRLNRQLRQLFPDGLPTDEERWQAKIDVVFHL